MNTKRSFHNILKAMVNGQWWTDYRPWTRDYQPWTILFLLISLSASAQTINRAEYFFDTDPGVGNGIALPFAPAAAINETYNLNIGSLSTGFHTFNARVRDNAKVWSLFTTRTFYIIPNP